MAAHPFVPFAVQYPPYVDAVEMWSVMAKAILIAIMVPR